MTPEQKRAIAIASARKRKMEHETSQVSEGLSTVSGAASNLVDLATFGFGDEISAGMATPVIAAGSALQGHPMGLGESYEAALNDIRINQKKFAQEHPKTAMGLNLAGAIASGKAITGLAPKGTGAVASTARAVMNPATVKQSVGSGAVAGAMGGFGSGEGLEGRLEGAVKGAAIGAPFGFGAGKVASMVTAKPQTLTADIIKSKSHEYYQAAEKAGGVLKANVTDGFIEKVVNRVAPQTEAGRLLSGDSKASKIISKITQLRGKQISLREAEEIDEFLGDAVDELMDAGRVTKQARKVLQVQDALREAIDGAEHADIVGGRAGFDALKSGRKLWAKAAQLRDIEKIITRSELMDNPVTGVKTGFRQIASNPERMKRYPEDVQKLIREAAKTGVVSDTLRSFGSRLVGIITLGADGGLGTTAAAMAGSQVARSAAGQMQLQRASKVHNAIANDGLVKPIPFTQRGLATPLSKILSGGK